MPLTRNIDVFSFSFSSTAALRTIYGRLLKKRPTGARQMSIPDQFMGTDRVDFKKNESKSKFQRE